MRLEDKVVQYLEFCRYRKELDEKTLKAYRIDLRQYFTYLASDVPLKEQIEEYITYLHRKYKQKTVKRKIASVKAFYNYLEDVEIIAENPFHKIKVRFKEKRMCEMIVQSASTHGTVKYSATRFGNVLGSAGSVIPLFKRQIANGGPVTVTDKRIIRYFMTIPEASQLVLQSGAIANNGELFVLDMGQPVKILDLAENMIRLSGVQGISVIETGLRPGEKLFEELLVKTEDLDKTSNSMIFIERDTALSAEEIDKKLEILKEACEQEDDLVAKEALRSVVPTFKRPEDVNKEVTVEERKTKEHKNARMKVAAF